jgi:hypothetical protein
LREKIPLAKVFADRLPVTALSILSAKLEQNKVIGAKPRKGKLAARTARALYAAKPMDHRSGGGAERRIDLME